MKPSRFDSERARFRAVLRAPARENVRHRRVGHACAVRLRISHILPGDSARRISDSKTSDRRWILGR